MHLLFSSVFLDGKIKIQTVAPLLQKHADAGLQDVTNVDCLGG